MTYTAVAGGGNWSSDATWGGAGHPVAGDTALLDATSGAVTVDANSACSTLDLTGYTSTLALGTYALTVSGNVTIGTTVGSVATLSIGISGGTGLTIGGDMLVALRGVITCVGASKVYCGGSWDGRLGTETWPTTSTLTLTGTGNLTSVPSVSHRFGNLVMAASGKTTTLLSDVWCYYATLGSGTLTGAQQLRLYANSGTPLTLGGGTISIATIYWRAAGGTLTVVGGNYGTSNLTFDPTSSATYNVSGNISVIGNLFISAGTVALSTYDLAFTGNVTIGASGIVTCSGVISVGGNWANSGTFTAGTSTVVFNDASKTTTVTGNTTFNILQVIAGKIVKFTALTTTTVTSFIANGTVGSQITLSNVSGTGVWTISDSAGTNSVSYCTISYSGAAGMASWQAYTSNGCVDAGGNGGWAFAPVSLYGGVFPRRLLSPNVRRWPSNVKGLQLRYKMNEGAGLRAFDSSGLQRYGTLAGTTKPAWQIGPKGRCLYFSGAGYVATPSFGLSGTVVVFAADVRCKFNASKWQVFIGCGYQLGNGTVQTTRLPNSDQLYWQYADGTGGWQRAAANNYFTSPHNDVWLHQCVVADFAGKKVYFYRNGLPFGSPVTMSGSPVFPATAMVKYIGDYDGTAANLLTDGYMANVQLWTLATMPPLAVVNASAARLAAGLWPVW